MMSIGEQASNPRSSQSAVSFVAVAVLALLVLTGCRQDMQDAPYIEEFEASEFWADGTGNRPLPEGTVARGLLKDDDHYYAGRTVTGELVDNLPAQIPLDRALLERGRERFNIYCSVCHDMAGGGRGMIVQRGFKQPQPLWEARLQAKPLGYFYDVITNGYGVMPSYRNQVPVADRWAIASYIRVLQVSQGSTLDSLPADVREDFPLQLERQAEVAAAMAAAAHGGHGEAHGAGHGDEHGDAAETYGSAADGHEPDEHGMPQPGDEDDTVGGAH